jgi:predicted membrane protein
MSQQNKRLGLGVILIGIGAIFLLGNLGIIPWEIRHYIFSWQGILIIVGSAMLVTRPDKTPGIILVSIGGFFLIPDLFNIPGFSVRVFWPLILIGIGIVFILRQRGQQPFQSREKSDDIDYLDDVNIFGGGEVVINSTSFKGGKVTSIFGGGSYNMVQAKLGDPPVVMDVFAAFGGCTFIVPNNWQVKVEVTSIFGGFSDSRTVLADAQPETENVLIVKGLVLFGGGEVKGY